MKILKTASYVEAMNRGIFKYKCDDCGEFTNLSRKDRSSRSIPRCTFCGSTYLDPVTDYANTTVQDNYKKFEDSIHNMREKMNY